MAYNFAPFYAGQEVVAVDAMPTSDFKNGTDYIIHSCHYSINPANGLGPFWYVGIVGFATWRGLGWYRPGIFAPKQTIFKEVAFEIEKPEVISAN